MQINNMDINQYLRSKNGVTLRKNTQTTKHMSVISDPSMKISKQGGNNNKHLLILDKKDTIEDKLRDHLQQSPLPQPAIVNFAQSIESPIEKCKH